MTLATPFAVTPPSRVTVASGWRAALLLPDGTVVPRAKVYWPASTDENVRDRGRVEVQVSVDGAAMKPLAPVAGSATEAFLDPAPIGSTVIAQARFVNAAGRWSAWTVSAPHIVVEPLSSQAQAVIDVSAAGWPGTKTAASVTTREERVLFESSTWEGVAGASGQGVVLVPRYDTRSTLVFDALRDGWTGQVINGELHPL